MYQIQQLIKQGEWTRAASRIVRHPDCESSANLQHLLGLCYLHSVEKVRAGVIALVRVIRSPDLHPDYHKNYPLATNELLKQKDFRHALVLVRMQIRLQSDADPALQALHVELLIREGRYRSALMYGRSLDDRYLSHFYAAICYSFLGQQGAANQAARDAFRAQPLKVFRHSAVPAAKKILVILAPGKHDFRPDISGQFSFSLHGGHFNTPVILNNLSLPHEITYLFLNSDMADDLTRWRSVLEQHDLIINAIADSETLRDELGLLQDLCRNVSAGCVINAPENVLLSNRTAFYQRCHGIPGIEIPKTCELDTSDKMDMTFPVLSRPPGSSTGIGLEINKTPEDLKTRMSQSSVPLICTEFFETADAEGLYTKFRVFIIDGIIYPEHCVTSTSWNVHSSSRQELMKNNVDLREKEQAFVTDITRCLTPTHIRSLRRLADQAALDYMGVDFTILDDDRLLIFEANAGMRINPDYLQDFDYLAAPVHKIIQAIGQLLLQRLSA